MLTVKYKFDYFNYYVGRSINITKGLFPWLNAQIYEKLRYLVISHLIVAITEIIDNLMRIRML